MKLFGWFQSKPTCEHDWEKIVIKRRTQKCGRVKFIYGGRTLWVCMKCGKEVYDDPNYDAKIHSGMHSGA